jgi:hypothetical protein
LLGLKRLTVTQKTLSVFNPTTWTLGTTKTPGTAHLKYLRHYRWIRQPTYPTRLQDQEWGCFSDGGNKFRPFEKIEDQGRWRFVGSGDVLFGDGEVRRVDGVCWDFFTEGGGKGLWGGFAIHEQSACLSPTNCHYYLLLVRGYVAKKVDLKYCILLEFFKKSQKVA